MANILVLGALGQLGNEIREWHEADPVEGRNHLIFSDLPKGDVTSFAHVGALVAMNEVNVIINCAAYTAVDRAEQEPDKAQAVNAAGAETVARAAKAYDASLIHISTDYVFDGAKRTPYAEQDPTNPQSVYGRTKLEGERAILESGCRYMIVRTSWLYSSYGHNFVKTMLGLGRQQGEVRVVDDQLGSPTYAADLADFIMRHAVPEMLVGRQSGEIYHYADAGATSWYGLAHEVMEQAGLSCRVVGIATSQYPTPAQRPAYSVLDTSKAVRDFGIEIPAWDVSLRRCLKKLL